MEGEGEWKGRERRWRVGGRGRNYILLLKSISKLEPVR